MLRHAVAHYPGEHRVLGLFGEGTMSAEFERLGIPVDVIDIGPALRRHAYREATGMIRTLLEQFRPSVVEAHLSYSRFFGMPAAWLAGVPVRIGFEQGDLYMDEWKHRIANYATQYAAQRVVVCSNALAGWASKTHGIQRHRMTVMHNCVDEQKFNPAVPEARDHFGFGPETTVVCAVGTLGKGVNKRVDIIIRAIGKLRRDGQDVALVVCGDGEQRPALESLIQELGIADRVRMPGLQRDVPRVLANCDVFCHAAPFEPFGIVCIEAMAVNLPAIVPDSGGIAEIVDEGVTGLKYRALDVEALARAIAALHRDAALRTKMGQQGRLTVLEKFTVHTYMERLYAMYDRLAAA
jgi:glycosyltransferase involved in cell wall biosynthesis